MNEEFTEKVYRILGELLADQMGKKLEKVTLIEKEREKHENVG